jgi:hypothetical protein
MHPADLETLRHLRDLSNAFINKSVCFETFYAAFCAEAHKFFELVIDELPDDLQAEVVFYLRWEGFGPYEGHVPVRTDWRYGESNEEYGWIDKTRFSEQFASEYRKVAHSSDG